MCDFKATLLIRANASGCLSRRQSLHLGSNAEGIQKISNGKLGYLKSLAPARDDESAGRETLQSLADGCARHAKLLGQLTLIKPVTGFSLAFQDFNFQPVNHSR